MSKRRATIKRKNAPAALAEAKEKSIFDFFKNEGQTWENWFDLQVITLSRPFKGTVDFIELPRWLQTLNLSVYLIFGFALFCYIVLRGTDNTMKTFYVSLDSTSELQNCESVPFVVTGTYAMDSTGLWSTNKNFHANSSGLQLTFDGFNATNKEYSASIRRMKQAFDNSGNIGAHRDLAWQYMAWSTISERDSVFPITLRSTANPGSMFKGKVVQVSIFNENNLACSNIDYNGHEQGLCNITSGGCNMDPPTAFISGKNLLRIHFPIRYYQKSKSLTSAYRTYEYFSDSIDVNYKYNSSFTPCGDSLFNPSLAWNFQKYNGFTYEYTKGNQFEDLVLNFDINSIYTCISVNTGIKPISHLTIVKKDLAIKIRNFFQFQFAVSYYVDPDYPNMDAIICIDKGNIIEGVVLKQALCVLWFMGSFIYPATWSSTWKSAPPTLPTRIQCKCTSERERAETGCSALTVGNLHFSLLYSKSAVGKRNDTNSRRLQFGALKAGAKFANMMYDDPKYGYLNITDAFSRVSTMTEEFNEAYKPWGSINYTKWEKSFTDNFCEKGSCGILEFAITEKNNFALLGSAINTNGALLSTFSTGPQIPFIQYGVSLGFNFTQLQCENSLSNTKAFEAMVAEPPVPLTQDFYKCSASLQKALLDNIGNGFAQSQLYIGLIMTFLLYVTVEYVNRIYRSKNDKIKSTAEQDMEHDANFRTLMEATNAIGKQMRSDGKLGEDPSLTTLQVNA